MKAKIGNEAVVRVPNRMGVMASITKIVAENGIDIEAVVACVEGTDAVIQLVTSDHLRTMDVLREHKLNVQEARVVLIEVPHEPGMLRNITEKLAPEQIDLIYLYATASGHDKCLIVLSSTNNNRAVVVLS